jgi:protein-L-isoaspartate O-methyltransferase
MTPPLLPSLAANFKGKPNVGCIHGDGTRLEFDIADVVYINAGATRPADIWLDRLADGGRLILPLTSKHALCTIPSAGSFLASRRRPLHRDYRVQRGHGSERVQACPVERGSLLTRRWRKADSNSRFNDKEPETE